MAAQLTRLTEKIAIKLHLMGETCTICSSRYRRPVRKLLYTPSYYKIWAAILGNEICERSLKTENRRFQSCQRDGYLYVFWFLSQTDTQAGVMLRSGHPL